MTVTQATTVPDRLEILIPEEQLQARISSLAQEINACYAQANPLVVICILKGGFMVTADITKHLTMPCQIEFIRLSSYGNAHQSSGTVKPLDLTLPSLAAKDVLLVEDIIDTGLTLNFLMDYLKSLHAPKSLRLAVLLDKHQARQQPVPIDFTGFQIDNHFVVGYGLDDAGLYRNLPYIGYFPPA